ncbi:pilus assembly protein [Antiquaquibacter oligotrophicus]|nr:pilus assembly protein [Antiquaquibacter oligotrophicus]
MRDENGSAVAEFVMVGALLTVLALAVVQLALALHVRTTLVDAAAEGARFAALADSSLDDGAIRTRELVAAALGPGYPIDVEVAESTFLGHPAVRVTVRGELPVVALFGPSGGLEVSGHAARQTLGE